MMPKLIPDKTENNMDKNCSLKTMFKSEEAKAEFELIFKQTCFLKNTCSINYEKMKLNVTNEDGGWAVEDRKLSEMVSNDCFNRIFEIQVTSNQLIHVVGCKKDIVNFSMVPSGFIHKEEIGFIVVLADIISTLVIYYMFRKMHSLNEEYLTILDNNVIRMKDFSVHVRRLKVDHTA
jgi:hypothetical protein